MCLGSSKSAAPAAAPPAPEAAPEEIIPTEKTSAQSEERKSTKAKASGLRDYVNPDLNTGTEGGKPLNVTL